METLRKAFLRTAVVGGSGSVVLMMMSGLRPPVFLIILFIGWVLSPFAALVFATIVSRRWPMIVKQTLYFLMLVIVLGSLAIYGYVLVRPPASQPASPYVAVPMASWLLIAIALSIAALISHRSKGE